MNEKKKLRIRLREANLPTEEEKEKHNVTHWPYRSWCVTCIKRKAKSSPHRKVHEDQDEDQENQATPTVSIYYMYMTKEGSKEDDGITDRGAPILAMLDHDSKMGFASVVQSKGIDPYAVVRLSNDVSLLG